MPIDAGRIEVVGTQQHAAWQARVLPPVEALDAGIWSVPVPIPDNPLRYTLSYVVPGDHGLVVVDPGWNTEEGWSALLAGLAAAGAGPADVLGIVATHVHPDHHGLSTRLRDASGAWVAMHPAERDTLPKRTAAARRNGPRQFVAGWLERSGAPADQAAELMAPFGGPDRPESTPMAEPDVLLEDGDTVPLPGRTLRAVWTPGHTPGHLCLLEPDAGVLLTGDHLLPRITPNIGLQPVTAEPPLARFLASLDRLADPGEFDPDLVALPAHEYRFRGVGVRARALRAHHEERCRELVDVVTRLGEPTLWQVAEHLTWSRPWAEVGPMRIGALAETAAHVRHLVDDAELAWSTGNPGGAGGVRVRTARNVA